MRLNKWLVLAGVASGRRQADELVRAGRVTVNNLPAELGTPIHESDTVLLDGKTLTITPAAAHIVLFHKPRGVVSSHRKQGKNRIIFDFLPQDFIQYTIVGRLDKESEGLMLLTNDGQLAHELMHPSFGIERRYMVRTKQTVELGHVDRLLKGVKLDDGLSKFKRCAIIGPNAIEVILEEGRNRQIRRTLAHIGLTVEQLVRVSHGPYDLLGLKPGEWRKEDLR